LILVLIHWRIKPTPDAEKSFFDYWTTMALINDKSNLTGEFLSAPLPANQFPFRVDDLFFGHGLLDCRHFINVGIWKDWESFYEQVGKYINDDQPILDFEAERRTRTVLKVQHWRIGQWPLPDRGSCD
jgi:hypothetical protein